jgi:GcrA cell cycle regulator
MAIHNIKWNDERDLRLRQLHAAGCTAEEAAKTLTREYDDFDVSRNAVLGRLWRLGMSIPRTTVGERARSNVLTTTRKGSTQVKYIRNTTQRPAQNKPQPKPALPVQVLDLLPHHCRWPVTPTTPWGFCGAGRVDGSPYCYRHTISARSGK